MYFHNVHNNLHGEIENTQKRGGALGPNRILDSSVLYMSSSPRVPVVPWTGLISVQCFVMFFCDAIIPGWFELSYVTY